MRAFSLFAVLTLAAACGGENPRPGTPANGGGWSELRISWSYGPCPDDGRSCHQTLTVHANGAFIAEETPNAPGSGGAGDPVRRFSALTARETHDLHRVVDAPGFLDKVGSFGCSHDADATIGLEVTTPSGVRRDEVSGCVRASDAQASLPRTVVELLEHHRFASHDVAPTHPRPPAGEGDDCSESAGCDKGLMCVIAPCVVAPCVNGTCQKLR